MNVNMNLGDTRLIVETCKEYGLLRNQAAYVLATAYWETARTMKPVVEAFWLSEGWRKRNLRYYPYHGRGYVQLTWERNYRKASKELGVDFIRYPQKLLEPVNSAKILVIGSKEGWFTGRKLSDYITLSKSNFAGARRIINGVDKKNTIAAIARKYDAALLANGYGVEGVKPTAKVDPEKEITVSKIDLEPTIITPSETPKTPTSKKVGGVLGVVIAVLKGLFTSKRKA